MLQTFKPAIRDCNTDFFQWILCNIVQFLRTPILKNNWVPTTASNYGNLAALCFSRKFDYYSEYGKLVILSKSKNSILNRTIQIFSGGHVSYMIIITYLNALFMVASILCRHASISHPYICETSCLRCPTLNSDMHVHALCILLAPLQIPYSV